jgi:hypothetical protein
MRDLLHPMYARGIIWDYPKPANLPFAAYCEELRAFVINYEMVLQPLSV